jgi:translocation and assembly module TamA
MTPQPVIASAPMTFPGRFTSGVVLLLSSFAAFAQSELVVKVKPANDALKANVEGYIGSLGDRDEAALLRFQTWRAGAGP